VNKLTDLRTRIRSLHMADETTVVTALAEQHGLDEKARAQVCDHAADLVRQIRQANNPGLMEVFLAEYGLSTDEGVALMSLAEALLRVPDAQTIDELIEDKIAPSSWGEHLGKSSSSLVNASTWALMLTGKVLNDSDEGGLANTLHSAVRRLGEPVIRAAVKRAMKELGHQFVLGENINDAITRGKKLGSLTLTTCSVKPHSPPPMQKNFLKPTAMRFGAFPITPPMRTFARTQVFPSSFPHCIHVMK